jgi:hypothetical protein
MNITVQGDNWYKQSFYDMCFEPNFLYSVSGTMAIIMAAIW